MAKSITFNEDCLKIMACYPDGYFDLAVVDPPYARGEDGGKKRSQWVRQKNGAKLYVSDGGYAKKNWDSAVPEHNYFTELRRVSKAQIVFGVNYYEGENFGPGRVVWDKCNDGTDQSDCEIAYNSLTDRVDMFRFMWRGMMQGKSLADGTTQQGNKKHNEIRIHPTQKPVELYRWLYMKYARPGWKILDTHLGSQSSRIAAYEANLDFFGCEIDKDYYTAGEKRFEEFSSQVCLFTDYEQEKMFL